MSGSFTWPVRVYYEDTDCGGVVYNANYVKFMERARTEALRELGFQQSLLRDAEGILFVVAGIELQFVAPARFDDLLTVESRITKLGRTAMIWQQDIRRGQEEKPLSRGSVKIGCVDAVSLQPCRIPASIQAALRQRLSG